MYTDPQSPAALPTRAAGGDSALPGAAAAMAATPGGGGKGMWTYAYKHGDRPLEGYTIERAAGRGGFGEVYYAISDAGREVALKSITGFEQIELRGIGQCMNLKSPHLVSIFDIRQSATGRSRATPSSGPRGGAVLGRCITPSPTPVARSRSSPSPVSNRSSCAASASA